MQYDIIQKPPCGRSENSEYYIVPVYSGTTDVKRMTDNIVRASSLTRGDVLAVISALKEEITTALQNGNKVRIDGLGTFRLRLSTPKKDLRANDKVAKKITVSDVTFRPESGFLIGFNDITFTRTANSRTLRRVANSETLLAKLSAYMENHEFVRRRDIETLASCSDATARRMLHTLVADGYLTNAGTRLAPAYRATEKLTSIDGKTTSQQ